jgi:hypothetical protein
MRKPSKKKRKLSKKDLRDGGWVETSSFVPATEAEKADTDEKAKSAAERQEKLREKYLRDQLSQINLITSIRPEVRSALKDLSQKIINDDVRAAVVAVAKAGSGIVSLVLDAESNEEIRKAVLIASEAPDIVKLGIRASRDDVRSAVEAVIASTELRILIEACSHNDETYGSVLTILRHPSALHFLAAIAGNPDLQASMEYAITLPGAAAVGHRVIMAPGLRGRVLRKLVEWVTSPTNRHRKW